MVGMRKQGTWTKWENVLQCKITWFNIWTNMSRAVADSITMAVNTMEMSPQC